MRNLNQLPAYVLANVASFVGKQIHRLATVATFARTWNGLLATAVTFARMWTAPIRVLFVSILVCGMIQSVRAESPIRAGDHIAIVGNTFADQLRIHGYLETMLLQHWPDNPVSIRNLGWGGDMLTARDRPTGFPTEETTLSEHQTDVIIACFGMGESFAGEVGLDAFKNDVLAFIDAYSGKTFNGKSEVRLVLVSPIAYEDLHTLKTPPSGDSSYVHQNVEKYEQRNRELRMYSRLMGEAATATRVLFVDLYESSRYLMDEPLGPDFTTNGIHLNAFGYWAVSHLLFRNLVVDDQRDVQQPWQVRMDSTTTATSARGVEVSEVARDSSGLTFAIKELTAPSLSPPTNENLPPQLMHERDTLTVANLEPGSYTLTVDGATVVAARHDDWAKGVAVDSSPAHREAELLRKAVNDKNLQFTYGWKALNQVHIVGERKSSPSGSALPAEVIEFKELASQRESQLRGLIQLKTRRWRLDRDGT